jgi:rhodanese-related sulfurtransferase
MAACGGGGGGGGGSGVDYGGTISGTDAAAGAELLEVATRIDGILALGYNTYGGPDKLFEALSDADLSNDVFVVDIRDTAAYDAGHIPGAINIPLQDLPMALLNGTSGIPTDQNVVVASDYGNDGNFASLVINAARILDPADTATYPYWSKSLTHGMNAWSFRSVTRSRFDDDLNVRRVETAGDTNPEPNLDQGAFPHISAFAATIDSTVEKILVRADDYINSFGNPDDFNSNGKDLYDNLNDGNAANDPQIISVRAASAYDSGHIPGAINIPYQDVADLVNGSLYVDPDQPVVVYCYTGHTGALATAALGILGYDVTNLLYGYNGWSGTAAASMQNFDATKGWDFPLNTPGNPIADLATYDPPSTGCDGCHTSLTAIYVDLLEDPASTVVEPPSSGEG